MLDGSRKTDLVLPPVKMTKLLNFSLLKKFSATINKSCWYYLFEKIIRAQEIPLQPSNKNIQEKEKISVTA
jgi:hypothetical protein